MSCRRERDERGPREWQRFIGCSGLKSVEPQKSPGCLRVPGLFFCYQTSRLVVSVPTESRQWGRSQAGRGWVGIGEDR